jgi:hypothetical protein
MLNSKKKSLFKTIVKNFTLLDKNMFYSIPAIYNNNYIQLSNLSKKNFTDFPIFFLKKNLQKKYRILNIKTISKYIVEQIYYSSFVPFKHKFYSWKLKNKFSFFYLNFRLKKNIYLHRFIPNSRKIFSSLAFSIFNILKDHRSKKNYSNFFYFLNLLNNNLYFISFFIFLFNKFLIFTFLGFKMYTFKKYKKFVNSYLTLNLLNINKFDIFKVNQITHKKFFRFNFYFKFI